LGHELHPSIIFIEARCPPPSFTTDACAFHRHKQTHSSFPPSGALFPAPTGKRLDHAGAFSAIQTGFPHPPRPRPLTFFPLLSSVGALSTIQPPSHPRASPPQRNGPPFPPPLIHKNAPSFAGRATTFLDVFANARSRFSGHEFQPSFIFSFERGVPLFPPQQFFFFSNVLTAALIGLSIPLLRRSHLLSFCDRPREGPIPPPENQQPVPIKADNAWLGGPIRNELRGLISPPFFFPRDPPQRSFSSSTAFVRFLLKVIVWQGFPPPIFSPFFRLPVDTTDSDRAAFPFFAPGKDRLYFYFFPSLGMLSPGTTFFSLNTLGRNR